MTRTDRFDAAEYADRLARVRDAMSATGLEVVLATDPANMYWLTGYDAWSFYSHQAVIVPLDADPIWWGRELDVAGARITTWLDDDRIIGFPEAHIQSDERHPHSDLGDLLTDLGHATAVVGVEMDAVHYTAAAHAALVAALPRATLRDATGLVNRSRAVKSEAELEQIRAAARVVSGAHARIMTTIRAGLPRHRLAAVIASASIDGVDGIAGDYPAIVPLMPSGEETAAPHLTWDERPFAGGETTFVEIAGCVARYHAPASRSYHLGEPTRALLEAEAAVLAASEAGVEAARAGRTAASVASAVFDTLSRRGFERTGRCGYPVGAAYPPDWGERTFSLRREDPTLLEPGMTLHLMPVLWTAGAGMGVTDTILIRPDGPAEVLTEVERRLRVPAG
jgi:ectoine hydrolase